MSELVIVGIITVCVFALAFYQSYRDKLRWKRIASGMSLFGEREDIPVLELEGKRFEANERRVLIVWGNAQHSGFETVSDAKRKLLQERNREKTNNARIFAWDGEAWRQRK